MWGKNTTSDSSPILPHLLLRGPPEAQLHNRAALQGFTQDQNVGTIHAATGKVTAQGKSETLVKFSAYKLLRQQCIWSQLPCLNPHLK